MNNSQEALQRAIDVARNHRLIEEEEICVDEDGRQYFERRLSEISKTCDDVPALIAQISPFSTTCWKTPHPDASEGRITWPWKLPA